MVQSINAVRRGVANNYVVGEDGRCVRCCYEHAHYDLGYFLPTAQSYRIQKDRVNDQSSSYLDDKYRTLDKYMCNCRSHICA